RRAGARRQSQEERQDRRHGGTEGEGGRHEQGLTARNRAVMVQHQAPLALRMPLRSDPWTLEAVRQTSPPSKFSFLSANTSGPSGNTSVWSGNTSSRRSPNSGPSGNTSGLSGNTSFVSGNTSPRPSPSSGLSGDTSGLSGNTSFLSGDTSSGGRGSPLQQPLPRRLAQVVARAHDAAVGSGVGDEGDVSLFRRRDAARTAEDVAGLADRADDVRQHRRRLVQTGQIDDRVVSAVEGGPDERVHPGLQSDEVHLTLVLHLDHPGEQHAGLGHQEAARLQPEAEAGIGGAEEVEQLVEGREVEAALPRALRHTEAASHVEDLDVRETLGGLRQEEGGLAPGLHRADAAAGVGV